jgi:hypothetical protein
VGISTQGVHEMERPQFKTQNEEIAFIAGMMAKSYPVQRTQVQIVLKQPKLKKAYELGMQYCEALFSGR